MLKNLIDEIAIENYHRVLVVAQLTLGLRIQPKKLNLPEETLPAFIDFHNQVDCATSVVYLRLPVSWLGLGLEREASIAYIARFSQA